jgi:hypothetical protein
MQHLFPQGCNLTVLGFIELLIDTKFKGDVYHVSSEMTYGSIQISILLLFFLEVLLGVVQPILESFSKFIDSCPGNTSCGIEEGRVEFRVGEHPMFHLLGVVFFILV